MRPTLNSIPPAQFFLHLWEEFNTDPTLHEWAAHSPFLPHLADSDASALHETVFSEMGAQYHALTTRAEDMLVQLVCSEVEGGLRAHRAAEASTTTSPT